MNDHLTRFMNDFSNGGAIRHMADRGMTVTEIVARLDFPMSKEKVAEIVWKHYLENGRIKLSISEEREKLEKVSYIEEYDKYGKMSMRRIVEYVDAPATEYIACDFGKQIYQDKDAFLQKISVLTKKEQEYILGLPWPLQTVYHVKDEFLKKIVEK